MEPDGLFLTFFCIEPVTAINSLHASFGSPLLPGWVSTGGDPCAEAWQGVSCNGTEINSMYDNPIHSFIYWIM